MELTKAEIDHIRDKTFFFRNQKNTAWTIEMPALLSHIDVLDLEIQRLRREIARLK